MIIIWNLLWCSTNFLFFYLFFKLSESMNNINSISLQLVYQRKFGQRRELKIEIVTDPQCMPRKILILK